MNTHKNIIERLRDAANIMHEHAQYNDEDSDCNGEGLAAETCEDASALITDLLSALEAMVSTHRTFRDVPKDEQEWTSLDDDAMDSAISAIAKAKGEA